MTNTQKKADAVEATAAKNENTQTGSNLKVVPSTQQQKDEKKEVEKLKQPEAVKQDEQKQPEPPKPVFTVEQLIERNAKMAMLIEKRNKVLTTKKELENFVISADSQTVTLHFEDQHGNEFTSHHSGLLKKVQQLILSEVNAGLADVNEQIINF